MSSAFGTHDLGPAATEPGASGRLVLPDPPLVDEAAGIQLRAWATTGGDAEALAAAWADPAIAAANQVPHDASVEAAQRWIASDGARRAAGRSLDLVVAPLVDIRGGGDRAAAGMASEHRGAVLGEVGLRNVDRDRRRAEISWWIAPAHRGRGVASAATRLLTTWALSRVGLDLAQVWARIPPSNVASTHVATAAGLTDLGTAAGTHVWARSADTEP